MKKIIALLLCLATAAVCFTSCKSRMAEKGDVTVIIEDENGDYDVYMIYLENIVHKHEGLLAVIKNLHARPRDPLHVVYTDESFSPRITEIGSLKESEGKYILFYTSVETDSYYGAKTVAYGETVLHLAGVGITMAEVKEGSVFLFRLEENPF